MLTFHVIGTTLAGKMDEFENTLRGMRLAEENARIEKENMEKRLAEEKDLAEKRNNEELPYNIFLAHTVFRNEIEPILRTVESAYLQGKENLRTNFRVFTGDIDEWISQWQGPKIFDGDYPRCSFDWEDNGERHDMVILSHTNFLNIEVGGGQKLGDLIHFSDQGWRDKFKKALVELLKDPEKTHYTVSSPSDDGPTGYS